MKHCTGILLLTVVVGVSGCEHGLLPDATPTAEQKRAKAEFDAAMAEQTRQQEGAKCQSYGARPGSDAFVQCMTNLSVADAQAATAAQQRRQDEKRRKIEALGRALQPPPSTQCTGSTVGNTTYMNCH